MQDMFIGQDVPPRILRRAQAEQLGSWFTGSPLAQEPGIRWFLFTMSLSAAIVLPFVIVGAALVGPAWLWVLLAFVLWIVGVALIWYSQHRAHRTNRLDCFAEGFIWQHACRLRVIRWQHISTITRGIYREADEVEGLAEKIDLDTLLVKGKTRALLFALQTGPWQYDEGSPTLSAYVPQSARAFLCDLIEERFVAAVLSETMGRYSLEGSSLQFGPLRVSQQGLEQKGNLWQARKLLPWDKVEHLEIGSEHVVIREKGHTVDWFRCFVPQIPNACLLKALVKQVR